jgi:Flp pilus assembly secretin CpaC
MVDDINIVRTAVEIDQIIIGNPTFADVSLLDTKKLVITGKFYGTTNIIALDKNGKKIFDDLVTVSENNDPRNVTLTKALENLSYHCSPRCSGTVVPGETYTKTVIGDINTREGMIKGNLRKSPRGLLAAAGAAGSFGIADLD